MATITATSHTGRIPATDGRSAQARMLKTIRAELIEHIGGNPSASHRMLIDRIAAIALRIHAMDADPSLSDAAEYIAATRLFSDLLAQLGVQAAPAVAADSFDEAAA